jgi:dihydrofolate synthase/folylpolyglutamate synthase
MSYSETISYLYGLRKQGIKFGLDNITRLLSELKNPHKSFPSIHVAGTNGKGSTSAIIASILQTAGVRVGLFTSPHLVSFTERMKIDGVEITESELVQLASEIKEIVSGIDDFSPTFFEVVTAMALLYFEREGINAAVIEVGMGGRLDATNIIVPEVSVITNIGYDHKEFLGNTIREIAYEKAGIIKSGIPVVTSHQEPEVREVIEKKAGEQQAELYIYGKDFSSTLTKEDMPGICFDYRNDSLALRDLFLPLTGEHQMQNASVAIKAIELLTKKSTCRFSLDSSNDSVREGLKRVRWPGRLELIHEDPPIVIDGAHNPAAAIALSRTLRNLFLRKYEKIILVLGIMDDKDISGVMKPLLPLASEIILTSASYSRAASPEKLADIAASLGFHNVRTSFFLKNALGMAIGIASTAKDQDSPGADQPDTLPFTPRPLPVILVTGSFYTIGEAKEVLGQRGVLTRLRE